jgi:hypothetical protein
MSSTLSNIHIFPFYNKSDGIDQKESKAFSHCEMVVSAVSVIIDFMLDTDVRIPLPCSNAKVRR